MIFDDNMRNQFKSALRQNLTDVTAVAWCLQNALSEGNYTLPELVRHAEALERKAEVINGYVARWNLLEGDAHEPTPAERLHDALDQLIAGYILSHRPTPLPSETTLTQLMHWSAEQVRKAKAE